MSSTFPRARRGWRARVSATAALLASMALTLSTCGDPTDPDAPVTSMTDSEESTLNGSKSNPTTTPPPLTKPPSAPPTRIPTKLPTQSPTKSPSTSSTQPPSTSTTSTSAPRSLAWIPFGPASPDTPIAPLAIYAQIQTDCPGAVADGAYKGGRGDEALFWEAAAEACVALQGSNSDAWRRATEAWFGGGSDYAIRNCYVDVVRDTMQAIMGTTADPEALPNIRLGSSALGYACPPTDLDLVPREGTTDTSVTLSWSGAPWMHYSGAVLFGDQRAALIGESDSFVRVMPPEHEPGPVAVVLALDNETVLDFGSYTYQ